MGLLFGVNGGNVGSWFGMGGHEAGLFPMTDKVLDILDGAHGRQCSQQGIPRI